ncbi:MAG: amidohydrolase family protein [Candidatus Heimdallarchaeota archaeon]|nr:MAG: amidohydrolase family protein [Candidatus Heimdallarchaeota archaeon]
MVIQQIFSKFALIGDNLTVKQDVLIDINNQGRISNINFNSTHENDVELSFPHHLLSPKFINSHTHLGDSVLKDQAFELSLNEAVGIKGWKYNVNKLDRTQRLAAMRSAIIEMIESGTAACYDFRENGLTGINELREAAIGLPIDLHILGRHDPRTDLIDILSQCDGLGLGSPLFFSREELEMIQQQVSSPDVFVATHVGEDPHVIRDSLDRFGLTDLQVALQYLDPNILIHLTKYDDNDLVEIPTSKFIVFCPRSNAYFGLGFPPISYFLNKRHLIGLGTDNVMTVAPNILEELRWVVLRLKEQGIPINPIQALKFITINPSKALKILTGCIKEKYWADLLVIDLQTNRTSFGKDPIMTLLFRCHLPEDISLNLFHGEVISNELS